MIEHQWKIQCKRNEDLSRQVVVPRKERLEILDAGHPLYVAPQSGLSTTASFTRAGRKNTQLLDENEVEPLGTAVSTAQCVSSSVVRLRVERTNIPWAEAKAKILKEFTTNATITVKASFLADGAVAYEENQGVTLERTLGRLELLESRSEEESFELTQKQYMDRISGLHTAMIAAWNSGQKVASLKLAIQCTKMLCDLDAPRLYPTIFVCVTEILDTFGDLIFDRIMARANEPEYGVVPIQLHDDFVSSEVPLHAQETCKNWFFKSVCIRELLPRIYIEIALLRCYRFILPVSEYSSAVTRIASMIRGIGDPFVAVYARTYLARAAALILPESEKESTLQSFHDYLFTFQEFRKVKITAYLKRHRLDEVEYIHLHSPAVHWLLGRIATHATQAIFNSVLEKYTEYCNSSMVLSCIIGTFDAKFWIQNASVMVLLIKESGPSKVKPALLFGCLAEKMAVTPPAREARRALLNEMWSTIREETDLGVYTEAAAMFALYIIAHFTEKDLLRLLKDFLDRILDCDLNEMPTASEHTARLLEHIALEASETSFLQACIHGNLTVIVDKLHNTHRFISSSQLLETFNRKVTVTSDPVLLHAIFHLAVVVHDSINYLTSDDEKRAITSQLQQFAQKIHMPNDVETQLRTYADYRRAFRRLDGVIDRLVCLVLRLAMYVHRSKSGVHSKKSSSFVKAAVTLIPDVPSRDLFEGQMRSNDSVVVQLISWLSSLLVFLPDNPTNGPLYLVRGLINAIDRYKWERRSERMKSCLAIAQLLSSLGQRVSHNDILRQLHQNTIQGAGFVLRSGEKQFVDELNLMYDGVIKDTMSLLVEMVGDAAQNYTPGDVQAAGFLQLATHLVANAEIPPHATAFIVKLIRRASTHGGGKSAFVQNTVRHIKGLCARLENFERNSHEPEYTGVHSNEHFKAARIRLHSIEAIANAL